MSLKTRLAAARKRLAAKHARDRALHKDIAHNVAVITDIKKDIAAAAVKSVIHPGATKVPYADAGPFIPGIAPKLVWHTTEGFSLPTYSGSAPHFTLDPRTGKLYQHIPIDRAAKALVHPASVETNRAHAIQVELIGFAKDAASWSDAEYAHIAELARWIEHNAGVPRRCGVTFANTPNRLSPAAWLTYSGHLGHQHVPGNEHWDPGALRISKVLQAMGRKNRNVGERNASRAAQRASGRKPRRVTVDQTRRERGL